ncbi:MAG: hypothetical protein IMZ47_03180 [Firmicutes bacterium]|nr:hypothetical protein [Bacillota bacterium]
MLEEPKREWGPEDEEASREGRSIALGNARRVRITNKKPSAKTLNTQDLVDSFDEHYGATGYVSEKEKKDENN